MKSEEIKKRRQQPVVFFKGEIIFVLGELCRFCSLFFEYEYVEGIDNFAVLVHFKVQVCAAE